MHSSKPNIQSNIHLQEKWISAVDMKIKNIEINIRFFLDKIYRTIENTPLKMTSADIVVRIPTSMIFNP